MGFGLPSSAAAHAAGQAFVASCPAGGASASVASTTLWYATVTCTGKTPFTLGPYSTQSAAASDAQFALLGCSGSPFAELVLPLSPMTRAQLEDAMRTALAALPNPLALEDLPTPAIPQSQSKPAPVRGGGFTTSTVDGQHYTAVTCDDGRAFEIGPSATVDDALTDGLLGLRVCANGDTLANLKLPESGALTRAQLESAMTATLAALPEGQVTFDALRSTPWGLHHGETVTIQSGTYTTWSSTTWSWSARCLLGGQSGAGSGYSTSAGATNAAQLWIGSANCPAGGGTYSIAQE